MKRMIFHIPMKIDRKRASASQIRPIKMLEAFRDCGYEVEVIEGYGKERKRKIHEIKKKIKQGVRYDFLYSESSTMPTLLTERNHIPLYPFLDFSFFRFCKRHGIKIGLFYRDIYWRFLSKNISWKSRIAKYFYRYDLWQYKELLDVLFVPSFEMLKYLRNDLSMPCYELPSGTILSSIERVQNNVGTIDILYVGGIGVHYDVDLLMRVVAKRPQFTLTICCREDDWNLVKESYQDVLSENIKIVHKVGQELEGLYANADVFCLFMQPDVYREFAVPYKLFEALGHFCPIIASEGTWVAQFVQRNQIGFTAQYNEESINKLLEELANHPEKLVDCRNRMRQVALENTWQKRCCKVIDVLS